MEHQELSYNDLETLKGMYAQAATSLKTALLEGASWEEVKTLRHNLTELEIALYKKVREADLNPAEYINRATG